MTYEYSMLAPVMFGIGASEKTGEKLKELGCKRALCICDEGIKKAGVLDKVVSILKDSGIDSLVFDKVLPDPPDTMLDEVGALVRECGADCVVGIGGGSSLDTAKVASILQKNPGSIDDYLNFDGPPSFVSGGIPVVLLPTTAGTGSEISPIVVVSHVEKNMKMVIFTSVTLAIVDPELCRTSPASVTANGGLDALAHAAEAITAKNRNPFTETLGLKAIKLIANNLAAACKDGNDMEARSNLSLASNFSGIAFPLADVHVGHAAADSISASYHTPHGLNCAWTTPAVMEICAETASDKVKLIGEAMGIAFNGNETTSEIGKLTADKIRQLMKECGVPSPSEFGIDRATLLSGAPYVIGSGISQNCPTEINEQSAGQLLALIYDSY